ncbi:hypothetical protein Tco_1222101, partial [Tanacetum coccineum]
QQERVVGFEEALNREGSRGGRNVEGSRPSEIETRENGNRGVNLPLLLAAHLGRNESGQPLQSSLTSVHGGHQPLINIGGIFLLTKQEKWQPTEHLMIEGKTSKDQENPLRTITEDRKVGIDHRHETNDCRQLRNQIEETMKSGQLFHLVKGIKKERVKASENQRVEGKKDKGTTPAEAPILMIRQDESYMKNNALEGFTSEGREITFPSRGSNSSAPVIIKAKIFGREVSRVHMDSGSSCESNLPYNMLLGRTAMQKMGVVVSIIHGAIKFHTTEGIGTVFSTYKSDKVKEGMKKVRETPPASEKRVFSCNVAEEKVMSKSARSTRGQASSSREETMEEKVRKFGLFNYEYHQMNYDNLTGLSIHHGGVVDWEFLSNKGLSQYEPLHKGVTFRFGGVENEMSLLELGWRVGLYFERESRDVVTLISLRRAETVNSTHLTHLFWPSIRDDMFNVGNTKAKSIRDPRINLVHRCITMTITGRKEITNRVTEIDLFYLYCIFGEGVVCNIPYWLAKYLKGVRDKSVIFEGMFVTKIARSFGLLTEEMVSVLNREPPSHVYRKKSLVKMEVIMELHEGECCWPITRGVVEEDKGDDEEGDGEGGNEGAGGSADIYRNMSTGDWQHMSTLENLEPHLQIDPFPEFEADYPPYGHNRHMPPGYTYHPDPSQDSSS